MLRLCPIFVLACWACAAPQLERHEFQQPAMGTTFRVVIYAQERTTAERAAQAAFERIHALDRALSDYDPESELSRLSRVSDRGTTSDWVTVSPDLFAVLAASDEQARATGGAFDVTVGPFVRLWRRARRQGELPSAERLAEARAAVGYTKLALDPERRAARLLADGMRLDLGGIAKGFALDEALAILEQHGLERALVDGGGDVRLGRAPPGRVGWNVEIVSVEGRPPARLQLARCALATSGDLERFVELDGVRYSHLVDPATGYGLTSRLFVSVVAPTGTAADAWASSLSVLGTERGFELLRSFPGVEARIVRIDGGASDQRAVSRTPGFPGAVSSTAR